MPVKKTTISKDKALPKEPTVGSAKSVSAVTKAGPSKAAAEPGAAVSDKAVAKRWGKDLTAGGWAALPNVIINNAAELGLTPLDMSIILKLASHWWERNTAPHPSKAGMAQAIGVDERTIQRRITALCNKGYLERNPRSSTKGGSLTNAYSLKGLIKAARPLALAEKARLEAKRMESSSRAKAAKKSGS